MSVNKIKGYRAMLGMSQKEMAEVLGLSLRGYSTKENGQSKFDANELVKIQQTFKEKNLEVSLDDLISS